MRWWAGIDIGSVSLKLVLLDERGALAEAVYRRTKGRPIAMLAEVLRGVADRFSRFEGIVTTGSGRDLAARLIGAVSRNEILTQARGAVTLTPDVRTIIEIGGQDSKLIFARRNPDSGRVEVLDHSLNEVCAAGTGSFLDQQAARLGLAAEDIGPLAMRSREPAFIAGRCAVFAKSDMMHMQQEGAAREDILAGLCLALARNYVGSVGKGRKFIEPINFQGGVAANPAVVRAFENVLDLAPGSIRVPEHFKVMGAYGAALCAREARFDAPFVVADMLPTLDERVRRGEELDIGPSLGSHRLRLLAPRPGTVTREPQLPPPAAAEPPRDVFLGVDIGAASAKVVLVDEQGEVVAGRYELTRGDPLATVRRLMTAFGRELGDRVRVRAAGVTGSGRYFVGALVGADVVVNEISSQARAARHIDPNVDTLIEIGGQDSKFVRFAHGAVVDFDMNKVCAAGTGSFLQEQAARLGFDVERDFARLACGSAAPGDLGTRCTVFMESDLIHHQQNGRKLEDLVAGLAYAVVSNYMEKVVGVRKIGNHVHFQGGVAGNGAVVAALENVLGKKVTVSPVHRITGALGAALYAREHYGRNPAATRFAGFDLEDRACEIDSFDCRGCENVCKVSRMTLASGEKVHFGGICDRYDVGERKSRYADTPDLLQQREEMFYACIAAGDEPSITRVGQTSRLSRQGQWNRRDACPTHDSHQSHDSPDRRDACPTDGAADAPVVGLPRTLFFFDSLPLWFTFLRRLGFRVELSAPTGRDLFYHGLRETQSESCLPVKLAYGHVLDLVERGIDTIFFPSEIELPHERDDLPRSYNCPFIQGAPYMMRATFGDRARFVAPAVYMAGDRENLRAAMRAAAVELGAPTERIEMAIDAGVTAQRRFAEARLAAGRAALADLDGRRAVVLLGKPHHLFDEGQNMHIAKKLRKLGVTAIPYDFLPLRDVELPEAFANVVWKNTHDLLRAAVFAAQRGLPTVMLTNFGCGPDSFGITYLDEVLADHPHLVIEVDDHTADAGMVTRLEAFLDTARPRPAAERAPVRGLDTVMRRRRGGLNPFAPAKELRRTLAGRTLYFPYVCPGMSEVLVAAMQAAGIRAETLPPQDERSEELGRRHAAGTECHPFIVTLGDFAKLAERPNFDPERAALGMFNYDGACRFSQYALGDKIAFKRLGLERVPVIGALISTRHDEFSRLFGLDCTQALWKGWVAAEVLQRRLFATRPYETTPGDADRAYRDAIRAVAAAVSRGGLRAYLRDEPLLEALRGGLDALRAVPVKRDEDRPKVGILGEFFTVLSSWANADLVRQLEGLGVEVKTHGFSVTNFLLLFAERYYAVERRRAGRPLAALYYELRKHWLARWADRIEAELGDDAGDFRLLHADEIMRNLGDYIHHDIDPVSTTYVARMVDFARKGVCGVNYLIVLNCMLSNMTLPIFRRIAADYYNLPVLATPYDGFKQTNTRTRLEAFVDQVRAVQERQRRF